TKCPALQTLLQQNLATDQILIQTHIPVGDLIQLDDTPSSPIQSSDNPELGRLLLYDYSKRNIITVEANFGSNLVRKNYKLTNKELIFEEYESSFAPDPLRPHQNLTVMSLWQAIIPSPKNIKYRFNCYIENPNKYLEVPYIPQLIANARKQITRILKVEL
ncbi:9909_t:CDS:2, partial [Scutellospora calospora]